MCTELKKNLPLKALSLRRVCVCAAGLLIIVSLFYVTSYAIGFAKRKNCQDTLSALGYAITAYSYEANNFPSNPIDLIPKHIDTLRLLMCPAVHHQKGDVPDGTDWGDYAYINWANYFDTPDKVPGDYPLLYDRALANHGGRGINIARVDGSVFWDPGAAWLRNFAASHTQYDIPVPK
jgi:prepilin-type processing-associated H-X9-DG protein